MAYKFDLSDNAVYQGAIQKITARSKLKTVLGYTLPDGGPFYTLVDGKIVREADLSVPETLPVMFRASRTKDAEITAIFPTLPWDALGRSITCYAAVGQHGACDHGFINRTRPAKSEEYADLLRELRGIYGVALYADDTPYDLKVYSRTTPAHRKVFNAAVRSN